MKFIEITPQVDKILATIFDYALKQAGMSVHAHIQSILQSVQEKEDSSKVEKIS